MYSSGYKKLFWGMVIITFRINIEYITILPEFIGYILIYYGLKNLYDQSKTYEKGKVPALLLIIISLKDVFFNLNNNIYNLDIMSIVVSSISTIIKIYLIYIIFASMVEVYGEHGEEKIVNDITFMWKFFLGVSLVYLFCAPFLENLNVDDRNVIIIAIGVVQMLANLLIASIFYRVKVMQD